MPRFALDPVHYYDGDDDDDDDDAYDIMKYYKILINSFTFSYSIGAL